MEHEKWSPKLSFAGVILDLKASVKVSIEKRFRTII